MLYTWNQYYIVWQLYFNKKLKSKYISMKCDWWKRFKGLFSHILCCSFIVRGLLQCRYNFVRKTLSVACTQIVFKILPCLLSRPICPCYSIYSSRNHPWKHHYTTSSTRDLQWSAPPYFQCSSIPGWQEGESWWRAWMEETTYSGVPFMV